jgi:RNA polymerase subunit RPABC4/transcription elongation factor Spt4
MRESLNCDSCNAVVQITEGICQYCGSDFQNKGTAAIILQLKSEMESMMFSKGIEPFLLEINQSRFIEHPIIKYRKAKLKYLNMVLNTRLFASKEFCEIFSLIEQVGSTCADYWNDFLWTVAKTIPASNVILPLEEFRSSLLFLKAKNAESKHLIESKLFEQVLITECGYLFYKEYKFYKDPKNFINDTSFIQKRDFLLLRFDDFKNKL